MIGAALQSVLRSGRDVLNAQFAAARRVYPELEGVAFGQFLETNVDPVAEAVAAAAPDRTADVVLAAYELGLELVGKRLVGNGVVAAGWRALAANAAPLLAESPRLLLTAVTNAVHNLATTPGARPDEWIAGLATLAPRCADAETLLKLGQVLAWRAGLAHYRAGALAVCDALPEALALAAVGGEASWPTVRERLGRDPWYVPAGAAPTARGVGSFRGFGGLFRAPPRIAAVEDQLVIASADDWWMLTADAFGATFHPAGAVERAARFGATLPRDVHVADGSVTVRGRNFPAALTGTLTSAASAGGTLALTTAFSHAVILVPLTEPT